MLWFILASSAAIILFSMVRSRRFVRVLFLSGLQGLIALFAVNYIGGFIGVHLAFNGFSAAVGVLAGLPGVILLLIGDIML